LDVSAAPPGLAYKAGRQTIESLRVVKQCARLLLARENALVISPAAPSPQADDHLLSSLCQVPPQDVLATIRRQRLEPLLYGDAYVAELLPELWPTLQKLARHETMAALALASLTAKIADLFAQAHIPIMVVKGVPLSLQTTGTISARGRGDLDLFVDPKEVGRAVALLNTYGFHMNDLENNGCTHNSFLGRYCRWVVNSLDLSRSWAQSWQAIDLHWRLHSWARTLAGFDESYAQHESMDIGGSTVFTLNKRHAFLHACAHAEADNWMCLRNLVDIYRLAVQLEADDLMAMQASHFVRSSCAVTMKVFGGPIQFEKIQHNILPKRYAEKATRHQMAEWRNGFTYNRAIPTILIMYFRILVSEDFEPGWRGWIGRLAEFMVTILPQGGLVNPKTGKTRLPFLYLAMRPLNYLLRIARRTQEGHPQ